MITTINRWGNSLAVRIPKAIAEEAAVTADTMVDISLEDERITIKPVRAQWKLNALVKAITRSNTHAETEWGETQGKEVW